MKYLHGKDFTLFPMFFLNYVDINCLKDEDGSYFICHAAAFILQEYTVRQKNRTGKNTWNALNPEDRGNGGVIDHIMYHPEKMKVIEGQIIEMEKPLSDHKPVWARLEIINPD